MDYWGWRIDQATQACMERGTSFFMDVLLPKGTSAGLKRLQHCRRWTMRWTRRTKHWSIASCLRAIPRRPASMTRPIR